MFNAEWCDELWRINKKIVRKKAKFVYLLYYPSIYLEELKDFTHKIKESVNIAGLETDDWIIASGIERRLDIPSTTFGTGLSNLSLWRTIGILRLKCYSIFTVKTIDYKQWPQWANEKARRKSCLLPAKPTKKLTSWNGVPKVLRTFRMTQWHTVMTSHYAR
jgi:hypothetical protein